MFFNFLKFLMMFLQKHRHTSGLFSGANSTVKPSAQPTLVRTQHPPQGPESLGYIRSAGSPRSRSTSWRNPKVTPTATSPISERREPRQVCRVVGEQVGIDRVSGRDVGVAEPTRHLVHRYACLSAEAC